MSKILYISLLASTIILIIAVFCAIIRLLIGKTLADRIVALDLISIILSCFIIIYVFFSQVLYLDVVVVLSLLSFLVLVAFAQFLANKKEHHE